MALVHHHTLFREGLSRILAAEGFRVVAQAGDAADILPGLGAESPDVVLLEWEAPGVGPAIVRQIADSPAGTAVVIMTRPETGEDLAPAMEAGASGCLSVNLDPEEFLAALRMVAQGALLVSCEMVAAVSGGANGGAIENRLTQRELEILCAVGRGATNQEIADELFLSPHTVKIHVRHLLAKLGFRNRQQAAAYAAAEGLIRPVQDAS